MGGACSISIRRDTCTCCYNWHVALGSEYYTEYSVELECSVGVRELMHLSMVCPTPPHPGTTGVIVGGLTKNPCPV